MHIKWIVTKSDIAQVKSFYKEYKANFFVQNRKRVIEKAASSPVSKSKFWRASVCCLLTTQQRSGPNSPVGRFVARKPFPLPYKECSTKRNLEAHVLKVLKAHGGLRRDRTIAHEVSENFAALEAGLWPEMRAKLEKARTSRTVEAERDAAGFIQDHFRGFGPKQSRNLLQAIGLSRYETPIDSRITKWLNQFGFPIRPTAAGLSDRHYYQVISDGFQQLSAACGILPCLLDAAIFSSYDGDEWTDANVYK